MIHQAFAFGCSLTVLTSQAQITITPVAEAKPKPIIPYDSTRNFLGNDYVQYVGQEFFVLPKAEVLRKYGFMNFTVKCSHSIVPDERNTYACCSSFNSKYEALAGKYLKVLGVNESEGYGDPCLKLQMKDGDEVIHYTYSPEFEHNFPFLVVGYFEKQKLRFKEKEVLIRPVPGDVGRYHKRTRNIDTGDDIVIEKGTYYKCLDLTVDEESFEPSLLCITSIGERFLWDLATKDLDIPRLMTKVQAEVYRKRFGDENWAVILEEKVRIGMTEEMARLSWGAPQEVNRSSSGDQWVYKDQYLYFTAGKLTAFN